MSTQRPPHARLPVRGTSAWDANRIEAFLHNHVAPLRLSLLAEGAPLIVPLWYYYADGCLWCASPERAYVSRLIARQDGCGFDISVNDIPYLGVRGQGEASLVKKDGEKVLRSLIDRYLGNDQSTLAQSLLRKADSEVAIRIQPKWITAWDFTPRMT